MTTTNKELLQQFKLECFRGAYTIISSLFIGRYNSYKNIDIDVKEIDKTFQFAEQLYIKGLKRDFLNVNQEDTRHFNKKGEIVNE